jgi:hypothetical protein
MRDSYLAKFFKEAQLGESTVEMKVEEPSKPLTLLSPTVKMEKFTKSVQPHAVPIAAVFYRLNRTVTNAPNPDFYTAKDIEQHMAEREKGTGLKK